MVQSKKYKPGEEIRVFCPTDNICVVDPGSIEIGVDPIEVTWVNDTADEIEVFVLSRNLGRPKPITIPGNGKDKIKINPRVPKGRFPYAVYCHKTHSFAAGGSEPEMIVP